MICATCEQPRRDTCVACNDLCVDCHGDGERFYRLNWLDPQTEESATCVTCGGSGMNPDFVLYQESYDDLVQRHQRAESVGDNFDEEFDRLLERQERLDSYSPQSAGAARAGARSSPGRSVVPLRPAAQRDPDEKKAA